VARIVAAVRKGGFDQAARGLADPYLDAARAALGRVTAGRTHGPERALLETVIRYVRDRDL
jgi:hypothetical protein